MAEAAATTSTTTVEWCRRLANLRQTKPWGGSIDDAYEKRLGWFVSRGTTAKQARTTTKPVSDDARRPLVASSTLVHHHRHIIKTVSHQIPFQTEKNCAGTNVNALGVSNSSRPSLTRPYLHCSRPVFVRRVARRASYSQLRRSASYLREGTYFSHTGADTFEVTWFVFPVSPSPDESGSKTTMWRDYVVLSSLFGRGPGSRQPRHLRVRG